MNTGTHILIILVVLMSVFGMSAFVLFFTRCPPSCSVSGVDSISLSDNIPKADYTQLVPIEDLFDTF